MTEQSQVAGASPEPIRKEPRRVAVVAAIVGGALLTVTPTLVELVAGDFFLLLPVGLLLALGSLLGLRLGRAGAWGWAFLVTLAVAILTEAFEQSLSGPVPTLADVLPPLFFTLSGIALLVATQRVRADSRG